MLIRLLCPESQREKKRESERERETGIFPALKLGGVKDINKSTSACRVRQDVCPFKGHSAEAAGMMGFPDGN